MSKRLRYGGRRTNRGSRFVPVSNLVKVLWWSGRRIVLRQMTREQINALDPDDRRFDSNRTALMAHACGLSQ